MGHMSEGLNLLVQMEHCRKSIQFGACMVLCEGATGPGQ